MRRVVPFVLAVGLALVAIVPASARTKYDTTTTFEYSPLLMAGFFGTVSSSNPDCVPKRKVTVFKARSGADKAMGTDRSNQMGSWFIAEGSVGSAKYYVKVRGKNLSGHDSCRPYRSPSQRFGA